MAGLSTEKIDGVSFDQDDRDLFFVDDLQLRANALKYSQLPKLTVLVNEAVRKIKEIYGIDALEDSGFLCSPAFRTIRKNKLDLAYNWASVGLRGKRQRNKWAGFDRKDGKEVQILPFLYLFDLDKEGIKIRLDLNWLTGISHGSRAKITNFLIGNQEIIHSIMYMSELSPHYQFGDDIGPITTMDEYYTDMLKHKNYNNNFSSVRAEGYPMGRDVLHGLVDNYVIFYPIYDSLLQIAMDKPARLNDLIRRLNSWLREHWDKRAYAQSPNQPESRTVNQETAMAAAEQRVSILPGLRWQVFARDNWRCLACGRHGAMDGVILHVDHILPRSKGGVDALDNYQTLCMECNLGKGNRDATDLRGRV